MKNRQTGNDSYCSCPAGICGSPRSARSPRPCMRSVSNSEKALHDFRFVAARFLPKMFLHLRVNELGNIPMMATKHLPRTFYAEIGLEVFHRLRGETVQQIGMIVVGDVIKIYQSADNVIFQSFFFDEPMPRVCNSRWPVLKYCTHSLVCWLRVAERIEFQFERPYIRNTQRLWVRQGFEGYRCLLLNQTACLLNDSREIGLSMTPSSVICAPVYCSVTA